MATTGYTTPELKLEPGAALLEVKATWKGGTDTVVFRWGDGSVAEAPLPVTEAGATATHTFTRAGTYVVGGLDAKGMSVSHTVKVPMYDGGRPDPGFVENFNTVIGDAPPLGPSGESWILNPDGTQTPAPAGAPVLTAATPAEITVA